ncbi:MAG: VWA domain-containing protein [Geitlerinemataceae cyanobacterium]
MTRRTILENPLFNIPAIAFGLCLAIALLSALLGLGRPNVNVAIALDLSNSTGDLANFEQPGSVMFEEIAAVKAYLERSNTTLDRPNQIKVFGFAGQTEPLTESFKADPEAVETEMLAKLSDPTLAGRLETERTDLNLAITDATNALLQVSDRCRELLVVTDGKPSTPLDPSLLAQIVAQGIKIHSIFVGVAPEDLAEAGQMSLTTGGLSLASEASELASSLQEKLFGSINSNIKWIIFWLGMAWIALMWMVILPLDRWVFQGMFGLRIDMAGRAAVSHALFWTTATLIAVWKFATIPFIKPC